MTIAHRLSRSAACRGKLTHKVFITMNRPTSSMSQAPFPQSSELARQGGASGIEHAISWPGALKRDSERKEKSR